MSDDHGGTGDEAGRRATGPAGPRHRHRLMLGAAAIAALGALAGVVVASGPGDPAERPAPPAAATMTAPAATEGSARPSDVPTVAGPTPPPVAPALRAGAADAPVTIVMFGDYQCPYCGTFARRVQPRLVRDYVERGEVQLVWRDFPYYGEESVDAAVAARAAGRQGKFWEYHDALYADQGRPRDGWLTDALLRTIASDLGLDMERFDADRRDAALRAGVQADFAFGQALGVPGTPAFLIGGRPFFGAQPYDAFRQAIARARAGR